MRKLFKKFKKTTYFFFAHYFAFWAKIVLKRWQPRVIAITGSVGKTTLMHLVEAQLGDKAAYTHRANSAYGIPVFLLDIMPVTNTPLEQIKLIILAPFKIFRKLPSQKFLVIEADCDRPGEGGFIGRLVKPEVVIWTSVDKTHSWNFSKFEKQGFNTLEEYIAISFGDLVRIASKQIVLLNPNKLMQKNVSTSKAGIITIKDTEISGYKLSKNKTNFKFKSVEYSIPATVQVEVATSAAAAVQLMDYLKIGEVDRSFKNFKLPPGRSTVFAGIRGTTLIDSTYNIDTLSLKSVLNLEDDYPVQPKWAVIGDMTEKGSVEAQEHYKIAELITKSKIDNLILYGRRTNQYTLPALQKNGYKKPVESFLQPQEVIDYLKSNLAGGEVVLFKGAGFLEGVVEKLLSNPKDVDKLCRREPIWRKRRAKWGL